MREAFDAVIIGAGITGCATAAELAQRGVSVMVLDKDDIAFEASGRNMGAIGILGKHAADLAQASVSKWDACAGNLPLPFEYQQMGRLCPASSDDDVAVLEEMRATAEAHGAQIQLLMSDEVYRRFPELAPGVVSAAYSPSDALVEPVAATQAFAALAMERGVEFRSGVRVHSVLVEGSRACGVRLDNGDRVRAECVLVAAGVWSHRLLKRADVWMPVQFASIYHGETQPMPPTFDYFLRGSDFGARQLSDGVVRVTGGYVDLGAGHYISLHDLRDLDIWAPRLWNRRREVQMRLDPRIIGYELRAAIGGQIAPTGYQPRIPRGFAESRLAALQKALPGLAPARIVKRIAGSVDMTPDALPILGEVESVRSLYIAAGFNGQGFGLGPVVGELMAQAIVGEPTSLSIEPYRLDRFADRRAIPFPPRLV